VDKRLLIYLQACSSDLYGLDSACLEASSQQGGHSEHLHLESVYRQVFAAQIEVSRVEWPASQHEHLLELLMGSPTIGRRGASSYFSIRARISS